MSVQLICCMDQLIDFLVGPCDLPPYCKFKPRRRCSSSENGLVILDTTDEHRTQHLF